MNERKFPMEESILYRMGSSVRTVVETVANNYVAAQPVTPFVFKTISKDGFLQLEDGRYDINLSNKFPDAPFGACGLAFGMLESQAKRKVETSVSCYGPVSIYQNNTLIYRSSVTEEVNVLVRQSIFVTLEKGFNTFLLVMEKVASGFGCIFGSARSTLNPLDVMSPFSNRFGQGGFLYALAHEPVDGTQMPPYDAFEEESPFSWFPTTTWNEKQQTLPPMERLFGLQPNQYAYAWCAIDLGLFKGKKTFNIQLQSHGQTQVFVDNNLVLDSASNKNQTALSLICGKHNVLVLSKCGNTHFGFDLLLDNKAKFVLPAPVKGTQDPWLYLGPFDENNLIALGQTENIFPTLNSLFNNGMKALYWQIDRPFTWVRPYLECSLFGKWNYPLGVTLRGILQASTFLQRADLLSYVHTHISQCTQLYDYSLWDKTQYGYPAINQKLVELSMLDDCGSFAATMLDCLKLERKNEPSFLAVAHKVAHYIMHEQERKEDGSFYRICKGYYQENTLWADDLYMSTPFLTKYFQLTGDASYIEEAAHMILRFKNHLFMEQKKLMSHVFDFKYNTKNAMPWGRGNGWVLFSTVEVLEFLPQQSPWRKDLLSFFRELSQGIVALQGKNGLWHQLLDHENSYEETSCTCMFCYAFSKGIRLGLYEDEKPYADAAAKAWNGLVEHAVDRFGNVHGVCWGSRYAFTPRYYTQELMFGTNDTHGIGILMIAGIEYEKLIEFYTND